MLNLFHFANVTRKTFPIALLALSASHALAVTVDSLGDSFNVNFNGIVDGHLQAGLTGSANFLVTNISSDEHGGENWDFSITLSNTSGSPITDSRISIFAFDTAIDADKSESSVSGVFNKIGSGNLAQIGTSELCFKDGGGTNNCSGGGNGGVLNGSSTTFFARLNFNTDINELALNNFAIRYQSISGSAWGSSGAGIGTEVPLPAPLALFGSALATLALKRRNRAQ